MRFSKWQGLGNDYVLVHARDLPGSGGGDGGSLSTELVRAICDRHFGIGADGILVLGPSTVADARMLIHNPDGSMAEMCGNGIRMAARFLVEAGVVDSGTFSVETPGGIVRPQVLADGRVRVDMGIAGTGEPEAVELESGAAFSGRAVSMGNPHFVIRQDPHDVELAKLGPQLELHPRFPDRTNVEFFRADAQDHVTMRVWERGVGETLACGTGACAVAVTAVLDAGCTSPLRVALPGGELEVEVTPDRRVFMTGPASETFSGEVDLDALALPPAAAHAAEGPTPALQEA